MEHNKNSKYLILSHLKITQVHKTVKDIPVLMCYLDPCAFYRAKL